MRRCLIRHTDDFISVIHTFSVNVVVYLSVLRADYSKRLHIMANECAPFSLRPFSLLHIYTESVGVAAVSVATLAVDLSASFLVTLVSPSAHEMAASQRLSWGFIVGWYVIPTVTYRRISQKNVSLNPPTKTQVSGIVNLLPAISFPKRTNLLWRRSSPANSSRATELYKTSSGFELRRVFGAVAFISTT
jgi:hypothetical protein